MKTKLRIIIALVVAFLLGALTMNLLTFPARRAYRENLQQLYLEHQRSAATQELREGNNLKAIMHLWNIVEAGPVDGSKLYNDDVLKEIDKSFWFFLLPQLNQLVRETVDITHGADNRLAALANGKLAAMLEISGHGDIAQPYWTETAKQLKITETAAKKTFIDLMIKEKKLKQ